MNSKKLISIISLIFIQTLFSQSSDTIALIGSHVITSKDFLERFELLPVFEKDKKEKHEQVKEQFLASLIAEKLYSFAAYSKNLVNHTELQNKKIELERMFVRDELFKQNIQSKIKITNLEVEEGLKRYIFDYLVLVLRFSSIKNEQQFISKSTNKKINIDSLRVNLNGVILDTLLIRFGEVNIEVENLIYKSAGKNIIGPIKLIGVGEVLFQVISKEVNEQALQKSLTERSTAVEKILKEQKLGIEAEKYFQNVVKNKIVTANVELFSTLCDSLHFILSADSNSHKSKELYFLTSKDFEQLKIKLKNNLQSAFIYFEKDSLTFETLLDGIKYQQTSFPFIDLEIIKKELNTQIKHFIEYELLYRDGKNLNLQYSKNVEKDIDMWLEGEIAQKYKNTICKNLYSNEACNKLLQEEVQKLAEQFSLKINFNNLNKTKTTLNNMVTWRMLGFGGRLLAVPSVEPNYIWFVNWKTQQKITQ